MKTCILVLAGLGLMVHAARAADPEPTQQEAVYDAHRGARNQLGVMEFCQARGSAGADVVDAQRRILAGLPSAQVPGTDEAEEAGQAGTMWLAGRLVPMTDAAAARGMTVDALCRQMESAFRLQARQLGF